AVAIPRSLPQNAAAVTPLSQAFGLPAPLKGSPWLLLPQGLVLAQHLEEGFLALGQGAWDGSACRRGVAAAAQGCAVGGGIEPRRRAHGEFHLSRLGVADHRAHQHAL